MTKIKKLTFNTLDKFVEYVYQAREKDPDTFMNIQIDKEKFKIETAKRLRERKFLNTTTLLAIHNHDVIGRIEYHFYGCYMDGFIMAYVDWVYIMKDYRNKGIAKKLFDYFEKDCLKHNVNQYYLIEATNQDAEIFYSSFEEVEHKNEIILRKTLK